MELTVAGQVYQGISRKIAAGVYEVGSFLPSCRSLAEELGVNKNTVNKAFTMLKGAGLVKPVPGSGMLVIRKPETTPLQSASAIASEMDRLLYQSRVAGLTEAETRQMFKESLVKWYESVRISIVLVECNEWDASSLASHIQQELPVSVTPMLLEDFVSRAKEIPGRFDLIVTTFYHLSEVNAALDQSRPTRVVALQDKPSVQSLLNLSEIPVGTRVGVVAGHERTIATLRDLAKSLGQEVVAHALLSDADEVRRLLYSVGAIVVSARCQTDLMRFSPTIPVVTIAFEVDQQSVEFLREKVTHSFDLKGAETY